MEEEQVNMSGSGKPPIAINAGFELTDSYMKSDRARNDPAAQAAAAAQAAVAAKAAAQQARQPEGRAKEPLQSRVQFEDEQNPLLESAEAQEMRKQEIQSAFLIGAVTGAIAIGSFFLVRWIFSKPKEALEAAEVAGEMLD